MNPNDKLNYESNIPNDFEQQKEFFKMEKALNDFLDTIKKIKPEYTSQAQTRCLAIIWDKLNRNSDK